MSSQRSSAHTYLVFIVGTEEYAMPVKRIREVVGYVPVIPFSKRQGLFQGIIPWRDELVPVVDLRVTVGGGSGWVTQHTCIVITGLPVDGEELLVGVVVDAVAEILEIPDHLSISSELPHSSGVPRYSHSLGSFSGRRRSVYINRQYPFGGE